MRLGRFSALRAYAVAGVGIISNTDMRHGLVWLVYRECKDD